MYVIVAGGGKVGANVARSLLRLGHEVTLVEQRRDQFERLEDEFEHQVQRGDATELYVLERAGIARPPDVLIHLLELRRENLEIVEVQIDGDSPSAGKRVEGLDLPEGSRLISVMRDGRAEIAVGSTVLEAGDQVLAILEPGKEDELRRVLLRR
jgi:Trk K+ transport system NAD-binding subunit